MSWSGYIPGSLLRKEPRICLNPDCRHSEGWHNEEDGCTFSYTNEDSIMADKPHRTVVCDCPELEYPPDDVA